MAPPKTSKIRELFKYNITKNRSICQLKKETNKRKHIEEDEDDDGDIAPPSGPESDNESLCLFELSVRTATYLCIITIASTLK